MTIPLFVDGPVDVTVRGRVTRSRPQGGRRAAGIRLQGVPAPARAALPGYAPVGASPA